MLINITKKMAWPSPKFKYDKFKMCTFNEEQKIARVGPTHTFARSSSISLINIIQIIRFPIDHLKSSMKTDLAPRSIARRLCPSASRIVNRSLAWSRNLSSVEQSSDGANNRAFEKAILWLRDRSCEQLIDRTRSIKRKCLLNFENKTCVSKPCWPS